MRKVDALGLTYIDLPTSQKSLEEVFVSLVSERS
jgi:hypothetical protein